MGNDSKLTVSNCSADQLERIRSDVHGASLLMCEATYPAYGSTTLSDSARDGSLNGMICSVLADADEFISSLEPGCGHAE